MTVMISIEFMAVEILFQENNRCKSNAANPLRAWNDERGQAGNDDRERRLTY